MGKEFSCFSTENNDTINSIINKEGFKQKIVTFAYIQPIHFHHDQFEPISEGDTHRKDARPKGEKPLDQTERDDFSKVESYDDFEEEKKFSEVEELRDLKTIKVKWDHFIKMKKRKFTDDYKIISEIGRGGFGCVFKVMMKSGKIFRAAKKILKQQLRKEDHEMLLAEMAIMKSLDHPNITKLFEVYDQKTCYIMVLELCDGGELFERIVEHKIREKEAKTIMYQVLSALNYLHSLGIVHRDIKPQNMLYERKTKLVKIIDFGISEKLKPGDYLTSRVGTPYYIAPEVLEKCYNEKYDIWSLGIVLYMIIFNTPPFVGSDPPEVMRKILQDPVKFKMTPCSSKFSPEAIIFLKKMLDKDPKYRSSAKELLDDRWLKDQRVSLKSLRFINDQALERITKFHFKNKLQAVVHTYIVSQLLTSEQRLQLLNLFRSIDKNKNGIIDSKEIKQVLLDKPRAIVIDDNKISQIIDFVDTNCSGSIDYTQFLVAAIDFEKMVTEKHFEQAFAYFDIDNNGEITFQEVAEFLSEQLDHEQIKLLFAQVDKNGDGTISKSEFVELLVGSKQ